MSIPKRIARLIRLKVLSGLKEVNQPDPTEDPETPEPAGPSRRPRDPKEAWALQVLELSAPADQQVALDEVNRAYRSMVRKYHPDRFSRDMDGERGRTANELLKIINEAHACLVSSLKKAKPDRL